jgi:hypothetical protein
MRVTAFSKLSRVRVVISLESGQPRMRDGTVKLYDPKAERLVEAEGGGRGINCALLKPQRVKGVKCTP